MTICIEVCTENLETLVENYMPLLIRTVSRLTNRYVSCEHDEEFVLALEAFAEAVVKYDASRGSFPAFAELVVASRLKSFLEKESKAHQALSLEELQERGVELAGPEREEAGRLELLEDISRFRTELAFFGLTLERLADEAPRHHDTRRTALRVGKTAAGDQLLVALTYRKRKLPVRETAKLCCVTEKVVKGSKTFILSVLVIFVKRLDNLISWLKETRCSHEL